MKKLSVTINLNVTRLDYLPKPENECEIANMALLSQDNGQYTIGYNFLTPSKYLIPFRLEIYKRDVNDVLNLIKLYTRNFQLTVSDNGGCDCIIEGYLTPTYKIQMMKSPILDGNQHHINSTMINPTQVVKSFRRINAPFRHRGNIEIVTPLSSRLKSFKKNKEAYKRYYFAGKKIA
jgi:hypothetical protein